MLGILQEPAVLWTIRIFLAIVFATAALPKLMHRDEFYGVLRNFRLLPQITTRPIALALPIVELAVAVGLLIPAIAAQASVIAAVLFAVFGVAISINILRGRSHIDCGCMRNGMRQELNWLLVGRNLVLTVLALGSAFGHARPFMGVSELMVSVLAGGFFALFYIVISMMGGLFAHIPQFSSRQGR